ncbi:MAG: hypothetical protein ACHQ4G_11050 [Opitutales bacterium]
MGAYDFNFDLPPGETFRPSPERVRALAALLPAEPFSFGPVVTDRAAWAPWQQHPFGLRALQEARALATQPTPPLDDAVYADCIARQDVTRVNQLLPAVRTRQTCFLLAEAIFDTGEFLAPIAADAHMLARLTSWIHPGNDRDSKALRRLTVENDLASCHCALNFALTDFILGPRLPAELRTLLRGEVEWRFFKPLRERIEAGRDIYWWLTVKHNWNAVCLSTYAHAAAAMLPAREDRAWWFALAESLIYNFTDGFADDGLCSEGVSYWNYGFMHFISLAEVLRLGTGNTLDLLDTPKARRMARFPDCAEIQPGRFPAFADCALDAKPFDWARVWLDNRRHSAPDIFAEPAPAGFDPFADMKFGMPDDALLWMFQTRDPRRPLKRHAASALRDWFEPSGFLICRSAPAAPRRFAATFLGGHNGVNHNHNDLGTFTVLLDGEVLIFDPGPEVYSWRTFSEQRYDSQLLNSYGHPVPRIGGTLQQPGPSHRAVVLAKEFTPDRDRMVFDLRTAYDVPALRKLEREFVFDRRGAGSLTITDTMEFTSPTEFESALITLGKFTHQGLHLHLAGERAALAIEASAEGLTLEVSTDTITQPPHPTRVALRSPVPIVRGTVRFVIRPA